MSHRENMICRAFQIFLAVFVVNVTTTGRTGARAADKPPNFLVIIADDQSPFDLKIYNSQSELETPEIDRLAARGMIFDGAYHMGSFSGAVCLPSRTMIMTGRTLWRLPNAPQSKTLCPPDIDQNTLPAVFNRAGYTTMRTCKIGNSYEPANRQFIVRHDETKRGGTPETGSPWHAERVIEFLQSRHSSQDVKPFLIYLGFSHPHDTRDGPEELLVKYGATNHQDPATTPALHPQQPKLAINYLMAHPFDTTHSDVRDEVDVSGVWRNRDEASIRNEMGRQFACSEYIDQQVGRVMRELERVGELENTYVIYTADHGMAIGRHGLMGKQNLYQHTWRVPFIMAGPAIREGIRVQGNIYLLDIMATLCDLAEIQKPTSNEGLSFKSVLKEREPAVREVMYGVYSGGSPPGIRSVQNGRWKLIQYQAPDRGIDKIQLFDLVSNPDELLEEHQMDNIQRLTGNQPSVLQRNLADDPDYATELAVMKALLNAQMRQWDDPYCD